MGLHPVRCARCPARDGENGAQVDTVALRVNDTVENLRVPLCGDCRTGLSEAVSRFLATGPLMVPA